MKQRFNRKSEGYQMFNMVFSFGISTALMAFLSYKAGDWLDRRLGTGPWLMLTLVILAIVASIRVLIRDLEQESKQKKNP